MLEAELSRYMLGTNSLRERIPHITIPWRKVVENYYLKSAAAGSLFGCTATILFSEFMVRQLPDNPAAMEYFHNYIQPASLLAPGISGVLIGGFLPNITRMIEPIIQKRFRTREEKVKIRAFSSELNPTRLADLSGIKRELKFLAC